ncbi:hypothetical protein BWD13_02065 [Leptospira santarosai serovar Grippotyphosa]|nr:hypothetical protein BWD13_02065 [Leptospira santarosai serovar Grippotyphosa]
MIAYRFLKDCLVVPIRVVVPTVFVLPIYRLFSDKVWLFALFEFYRRLPLLLTIVIENFASKRQFVHRIQGNLT